MRFVRSDNELNIPPVSISLHTQRQERKERKERQGYLYQPNINQIRDNTCQSTNEGLLGIRLTVPLKCEQNLNILFFEFIYCNVY